MQFENRQKKMNTLIDKEEDLDILDVKNDLSTEEHAYWDAAIEEDLRDIAKEHEHAYMSLDEFEKELTTAVKRQYARV